MYELLDEPLEDVGEGDIYSKSRELMLEDDALSPEEEAFMEGYDQAQ